MKKIASLKTNVFFSVLKAFASVLFPLLLYKHVTNVLLVEGIGIVDYSKSIVNYFVLLAGLGIETFAIQSGSKIRDDKEKLEKFAKVVFGIHTLSTISALGLLMALTFSIPSINDARPFVLIFSIELPLMLVGLDWVYYVHEDFRFVSIKYIVSQILSYVFALVFIRDENGLILYALALLIATYAGNIVGFFCSRKYLKIGFSYCKDTLVYLPVILILFLNQIATVIYVNSDITMLKIFCGERAVGLYTAPTKIYSGIKTVFNAFFITLIPKCSFLVGREEKKEDYLILLKKIISAILFITPPCIAGLIMEGKNLILLISKPEYLETYSTLIILSIALIFSIMAMFCSSALLLPNKRNKLILISTLSGALFNLVANLFVLPRMGYIGAALTTLISELLVMLIMLIFELRTVIKLFCKKTLFDLCQVSLGTAIIVVVCYFTNKLHIHYFWILLISVSSSVLLYGLSGLLLKNSCCMLFLELVKNKFGSKKRTEY